MSTKISVILTDNDEHMYREMIEDECVLEFLKKNIKIVDEDDYLTIMIKPGSDLYDQVYNLFRYSADSIRQLESAIEMLRVATCPNRTCDMGTLHSDGREQCQWCDERNKLIHQYEKL